MAVGSAQTGNIRNIGHRRVRRGIGVRARISLPLLIPVLGLLALSGLLLQQKRAEVASMQRVGTLTELVTDTSALVHEVQRERGLSAGFLGSKGTELGDDLLAQRQRTDARFGAFDARLRHIDMDHASPQLALLPESSPPPVMLWRNSAMFGSRSVNSLSRLQTALNTLLR
jgi:hypothetical protein